MLSFEELEYRLTTDDDLDGQWLNAYVDDQGRYWLQRYGGLGTSHYSQLEDGHPFIDYINRLLEGGVITQDEFSHQYELDIDLAQLIPLTSTKLYKQLTSEESRDAADELFEATPKDLGDSISDEAL